MKKLIVLLFLLLMACGGESENQDCQDVRVTPPSGNPYWVTICTDDNGAIIVLNSETERGK